jgi:cell division protein ZipA
MIEGLSDTALLRIGIIAAALLLFTVILLTSRRKSAQGRRLAARPVVEGGVRQEPTLKELIEADVQREAMGATGEDGEPAQVLPGARPEQDFDKIVTIYLAARAGRSLSGPDLVVAAEKAGLTYGHMGIFHRLTDKHPQRGPVFSVANLVKPGSFDLRAIKELETPGISFFMTLPGPLSALDAWEAMLPIATRMAELLDGVLLDGERNALGRQRIAHIRDELREYDRARERLDIKPGR